MKSFVLFVIATLAAVHCMSIGNIEKQNKINNLLSQKIKSLFCTEEKIDDIQSVITNEEVMQKLKKLKENSMQQFQKLFCDDESTTSTVPMEATNSDAKSINPRSIIAVPETNIVNASHVNISNATEFTNTDGNTTISRSAYQPDSIKLTGITVDNTPSDVTEVSCQLPLWNPKICDIACFVDKKLAFMECFKNYMKQNVLLSLGRNPTTHA